MLSGNLSQRFAIYRSKHSKLYVLGVMLFFWAIFDASFSYLVPVVITQSGYTRTFMGLVLGSSSLFGAGLDLLLSKFLHNTHFRRIYLVMFGLCFLCPALLWKDNPLFVFVGAMAVWGFYYDLFNFGNIDFVSRKSAPKEHSHCFGVIWVFRALGYSIAPLLIGAVVSEVVDFKPYLLMWVFVARAFETVQKKYPNENYSTAEKKHFVETLTEVVIEFLTFIGLKVEQRQEFQLLSSPSSSSV